MDARTDVYALGAMLYSCLTGLAPYARDTEVAVLQAHLLEPPPKLKDQRPDLPRGLDRVIATAMAKSKDDRYESCGDLLAAAEAAAHERSTQPAVEGTVLASQQPEADESADPAETVLASETAALGRRDGRGLCGGDGRGARPDTDRDVSSRGTAVRHLSRPTIGRTSRRAAPAECRRRGAAVEARTRPESVGGCSSARSWSRSSRSSPCWQPSSPRAAAAAARASGNDKGTTFNVPLSSSAEVPTSISTTSSGTASVTIAGKKVCWAFTLRGVDHPNAAHIHNGGPTVSGPVVVPLGAAFAQSGCTTAPSNVTERDSRLACDVLRERALAEVPRRCSSRTARGRRVDGGPDRIDVAARRGDRRASSRPGSSRAARSRPRRKAGAVQTAECVPPANSQSFYPDHLQLSTYTSTPALLKAYNAQRADAGAGMNFGRCDRTSWGGEGPWVHPGSPPKPGGRRFCYFDGNNAVMVWAHEKLGQASHVDFLGIAREGGSDHSRLYSWWNFWIHLMGKCLQEGCTASAK